MKSETKIQRKSLLHNTSNGLNQLKSKKKMIKTTENSMLVRSVRDINRNFYIKVYGVDENGKKLDKLVGVSGILELIGYEFLNKFITRAFACKEDVCVCKLRRGLKVSFYYK